MRHPKANLFFCVWRPLLLLPLLENKFPQLNLLLSLLFSPSPFPSLSIFMKICLTKKVCWLDQVLGSLLFQLLSLHTQEHMWPTRAIIPDAWGGWGRKIINSRPACIQNKLKLSLATVARTCQNKKKVQRRGLAIFVGDKSVCLLLPRPCSIPVVVSLYQHMLFTHPFSPGILILVCTPEYHANFKQKQALGPLSAADDILMGLLHHQRDIPMLILKF